MGIKAWISVVSFFCGVVNGFTPEQLISAPRRTAAIPNSVGDLAIYYVSSYSFETHKNTHTWNLLDLGTGDTSVLFPEPEVSEVVWIADNAVLYINGTNADIAGGVELWVSDITDSSIRYKAASLAAPLANLKAVSTPSGVSYAVSGLAYPNGTAYNAEILEEPLSSARIYDSLFVRHWDTYITPQRYAIFAGSLSISNGVYSSSGGLKNLFSGIEGLESPVQPFGGTSDFDISPDGQKVTFLSKDPVLNPANNTASYIYLVPHSGLEKPVAINLPSESYSPEGASASPVFSPSGKTLAYLQQDENGYESDKNKIYVYDLENQSISVLSEDWDRSLESLSWSKDGKILLLIAGEYGRGKLWALPATAKNAEKPKAITGTENGSVGLAVPLSDDELLLSTSSFVSSAGFSRLQLSSGEVTTLLDPNAIDAELKGISKSSVGDFWYQGAASKVHGWIIKPEGFDEEKKYPIAFLIHGGPQDSWADAWNTRWSPKVFAEQGYVSIAINPTGSTGYGKEFEDAIQNDWGGAPYVDLVKGFEYILETYPFLDADRAVALGASYGGYMVNWIQGHDFGRRFKALVTHDGVFSTLNQITSEELYFPQHDFNGTLWDDRANFERWDPAAHIVNWSTPQLVIHNDLDYRLPFPEGLAVFNALQVRGVPSRFMNFPDENHLVLNPENSLVWHKEVIGWINKWIADI
ncbi:putative dipeptidyl-peptidase 5 [Morchella conica CCBAS932]|uniref:Dipeptidyl-peptidase V n=1 Tax=Morchella conica CCBAS932 TaxID=1392247 RepID=A0A3N4KCC4_9PEZI|nr:putative dipeptidyl-peptidase 5 [Morchella conica CCBAS932]